eukprot:1175870-Prorocentrum_minimum.AAC.8
MSQPNRREISKDAVKYTKSENRSHSDLPRDLAAAGGRITRCMVTTVSGVVGILKSEEEEEP